MSGALNNEAPGWTVIRSLPEVAASTSLAKATRFSECGLSAGYAAGKFHLVWAKTGVAASMAPTIRPARMRRDFIGLLLTVELRSVGESEFGQKHHDLRILGDDEHRGQQQHKERERRARNGDGIAADHVLKHEQVEADRRRDLRHVD